MNSLLAALVNFISSAGYVGLAVLLAADAANIPIPSELSLAFAGYLVSTGQLAFWPAVIVGTLGYSLGAAFSYWLGYRGGRPFVQRYGRFVFITHRDLELADKLFARFGAAIAFFSRFVPVVRTFISLPAGIARMPFGRFITYTTAGGFIWSVLFVWLGLKFGQNYDVIRERFHGIDIAIAVVIGLGIVAWIVRFFVHQRRERHARGTSVPAQR
ncbi:MAG: DedA family protein [Candidatus Andersenbacteria bacterium]